MKETSHAMLVKMRGVEKLAEGSQSDRQINMTEVIDAYKRLE